jgi:hypothetical protein
MSIRRRRATPGCPESGKSTRGRSRNLARRSVRGSCHDQRGCEAGELVEGHRSARLNRRVGRFQ